MNEIYSYLAHAAGLNTVKIGQDITIHVDLAVAHDVTAPMAISQFEKIGIDKVFNPDKVMIIFDHVFPAPNISARNNHRQLIDFAKQYKIRCFSKGEGVIHQIVFEKGNLVKGNILVGADSHTCTAGAYGVLAFGVGSTELAVAMATGRLDIEVPPVQVIKLEGKLKPGVYAKDIILYLIGKFGTDGFTDQSIIFSGSWVNNADVEEKMTISNMTIEMGAMLSYFSDSDDESNQSDIYKQHLIEVNKLAPVVACPHSPGNVKFITDIVDTKISQAVIGSCTNGRLSDMRIVAEIFENFKVNPSVTCIVLPASNTILQAMEKEGLTKIMRKAGATVVNAGCGPCYGGHMGLVTSEDVIISTTNRNFPGRMGAKDAQIYLASPRSVAESAVCGKIVAPGTILPLKECELV